MEKKLLEKNPFQPLKNVGYPFSLHYISQVVQGGGVMEFGFFFHAYPVSASLYEMPPDLMRWHCCHLVGSLKQLITHLIELVLCNR